MRKRIKRRKELGFKDWCDKSCIRKKREVKRSYKKWKREKIGKEKYMEERKFRELLEKKQKEKREEEEEELKKLKKEAEVWKYINKKRGKKKWKENNIKKEEWRNYFRRLLDSLEEVEISGEKEEEEREQGEEEIEEVEIKEAVRKMKTREAAGVDGITMEAWKFAGERLWKKWSS